MDNDLLKYHIKRSDDNFRSIEKRFDVVERSLDDLREFKISMVVASRYTSLIVSGIAGLITLAVSTFVLPWVKSHFGG
jgi:hypothetical protein